VPGQLPEQGEKLIFIRTLGMVLLLAFNVIPHDWEMRGTHTEGSIALLPREADAMFPHPAGRVRLENLDNLGNGHVRRQCDQDVDVIGCATRDENGDFVVPPNTSKISP
jgi:hypothetical protein